MQAKVFRANNPNELQTHLQRWLDTNPTVTITHIAQSQDNYGGIVVTLLYTTAQS